MMPLESVEQAVNSLSLPRERVVPIEDGGSTWRPPKIFGDITTSRARGWLVRHDYRSAPAQWRGGVWSGRQASQSLALQPLWRQAHRNPHKGPLSLPPSSGTPIRLARLAVPMGTAWAVCHTLRARPTTIVWLWSSFPHCSYEDKLSRIASKTVGPGGDITSDTVCDIQRCLLRGNNLLLNILTDETPVREHNCSILTEASSFIPIHDEVFNITADLRYELRPKQSPAYLKHTLSLAEIRKGTKKKKNPMRLCEHRNVCKRHTDHNVHDNCDKPVKFFFFQRPFPIWHFATYYSSSPPRSDWHSQVLITFVSGKRGKRRARKT